ncbi:hypothetical protein MJD09_09060 [bacterium]|nr:hypothetical protein [bacterium]
MKSTSSTIAGWSGRYPILTMLALVSISSMFTLTLGEFALRLIGMESGYVPRYKRFRPVERLEVYDTFFTEADNEGEILQVRCDGCRAVLSFPFERVLKTGRILTEDEFQDRTEALSQVFDYDPKQSYWRGQKIRHHKWDDVGKVVDKKQTQDNHKIIIVDFEKIGRKQLVEET